MSSQSDNDFTADGVYPSKLDVIDTALDALKLQLAALDKAGFSIASIHLNDAIERLRTERVRLATRM